MTKPFLFGCGVGVVGVCWLAVVGMMPNDPKAAESVNADRVFPVHATLDELAAYTIQSLNVPEDVGAPFSTTVRIDNQDYVLNLTGHSLRSDDFQLLVQYAGDENLHRVDPPAPRTYKGTVEGVADAWVAGSVLDEGLSLTVAFPDGVRYEVAPLDFYAEGTGPSDEHVVFRARDTILTDAWSCATDTFGADFDLPAEGEQGDEGGIAGTTTKVVDISFDTDAEFYQLNGSSVLSTTVDIENVMVRIENIYEAEVNMTYEVTTIIVRTDAATDPYTSNSSSTLLGQFDSHWSSTKSDVRRDIAHMMTGRNSLDGGGTLGIAQLNQTCNTTGAYGLSASRFTSNLTLRACVTAHEIGHNFNAGHCQGDCSSTPGGDCRIMCPCVNSCAGDCLQFGVSETNQIVAKRNASACLSNEVLPVDPPFFDDFPTTTISTTKWGYVDGVVANNLGVSPPSGVNALQINAASNTEFADDEIRTTFIRLNGLGSATVSYYTQARGVEAGEQLVVEYWAGNLRWVELARYTADGIDQNTFQFRTHTLTGSNALHAEFRLRFRAEVDQANDNWYVDDVSVSAVAAGQSLNILSSPVDGANVLVSPADTMGQAGGTTPFSRTYNNGAVVTLIAPGSLNGQAFSRWTVNGVNQPLGQTSINVTMNAATTAVANYPEPSFSLSVQSLPGNGANVLVTPADNGGFAGGTTPFVRNYNSGVNVTLIAPAALAGENFSYWTVNGVDQPIGQGTIVVPMTGATTCVATFAPTTLLLDVTSTPESGANITISPADENGASSGPTPLSREYELDTVVNLQAPASLNGGDFIRWVVNGANQPLGVTSVNVTMDEGRNAEAQYEAPITTFVLSVNSTPTAGVNITVTPNDTFGAGNGATSFQRTYNSGTLVTLTAPNLTSTLTFRRWVVGGIDQPVDQLSTQVTVTAGTTASAVYRLIGDANCDGTVDFFDIDPFLAALFDPPTYAATYCDGSTDTVDCDGSTAVDFFDIDAFLAILFG